MIQEPTASTSRKSDNTGHNVSRAELDVEDDAPVGPGSAYTANAS